MSKISGLVVNSDERAHLTEVLMWVMIGSSLSIHLFIRGPNM